MVTEKNGGVDYRFRLLYALGMIFIVSGHCGGGGVSLFYDWFPPYAFHLGLFAFCSGYFYRDENGADLGAYALRKAKTLLLPMYLWNLFYALLLVVLRRFGFDIGLPPSFATLVTMPLYEGSQFELNMGAWFVVPLFLCQVFTAALRKLCAVSRSRGRELAAFLFCLALGALGVTLARHGFLRLWRLLLIRFLYFLPFYAFGVFYRRVLERLDTLPHGPYFALVFLAQYLIILLCGRIPYYTPSRCDDFLEPGIVPFLVGYVGIAFWLRMAKILAPSLGKDKWLNAIADHSYSIMVNQYLGFMAVKAGFAFLKRFTSRCQAFDMAAFKSNIAYFYTPGGRIFFLVYLVAGLVVPIAMQKAVDRLKLAVLSLRRTQRA